jgi:integrase/recombinase XerD
MNQLVPYSNRSSMMLKKPVEYITLQEAESIKRACDIVYKKSSHSENDEWIRDRDRLLLQMMWTTGARISDVLSIEDNNINFTNKTVTFLVKKRKDKDNKTGEFWHTISIDMETLGELMAYIHSWQVKGFLFKSYRNSGKALTRQAVLQKVKSLAEIAGFTKNIYCHLWRHGLAKYLQGQGVYAELIAFHLAHSSTQVTLSTYARLDAQGEKSAFESMGFRLR